MNLERIKTITNTAKEAVKDLDPDLKEIAFQTILNKLLEQEYGEVTTKKKEEKTPKKGKRAKKAVKVRAHEIDETTSKLIKEINRTKYAPMFDLKLTLDRSLYTLKIARDELDIDGLMPSQVSAVLQENFRLKASPNAVSMALMDATKYVDRRPAETKGGKGYTYHIMHEGEKYLEDLLENLKNQNEAKDK